MWSASNFRTTDDLPRLTAKRQSLGPFYCMARFFFQYIYEPPFDQSNKIISAPSEGSDQPGHPHSLIRVFAVRMKTHWVISCQLCVLRMFWSDWADALIDLSLRWTHRSFCAAAHMLDSQLGYIPQVGQFQQLGRSYPCNLTSNHKLVRNFWRHVTENKLPSHKVNSASCICFSLTFVCLCVFFGTSINIHIQI